MPGSAHTYSSLATNLIFKQSGVTRMTTGKQYDNLNRLTRVSSQPGASGASPVTFAYTYNSANQRTRVTREDNAYWDYGYDSLGQVTQGRKRFSDGSAVAGEQFEYAYDDIGNRKHAGSGGNRWGTGLHFEQYSANALNQYTERTVPGVLDIIGTATNSATVTVNNRSSERQGDFFHVKLDLANQEAAVWASITNVAVLNQGTNDLIATNLGNLFLPKTPELFGYDADGNLTNDGRWSYTWDAENRLIQMTAHASLPTGARKELKFAYDDQSRRLYRKISTWTGSSYTPTQTNYYYWAGWTCIGEYFPGGGRSYLWGNDLSGTKEGAGGVGGLLLAWDGSSAHFYAYDGNGNVSATVSGGDGTITATYEYDPFGKVLRETGSYARTNPYRFSTKYTDADTDLVYYGYRYYNSTLGRWPNRDPLGESAGPNLSLFCESDSVNCIDKLGMFSISSTALDLVRNRIREAYTELRDYETIKETGLLRVMLKEFQVTYSINAEVNSRKVGNALAKYYPSTDTIYIDRLIPGPSKTTVVHELAHAVYDVMFKYPDDIRRDETDAWVVQRYYEMSAGFLAKIEDRAKSIDCDWMRIQWKAFWSQYGTIPGGGWLTKAAPDVSSITAADIRRARADFGVHLSCTSIAQIINSILQKNFACCRVSCSVGPSDYIIGTRVPVHEVFE